MKKITILLLSVFMIGFLSESNGQALKKGLSIKAQLGFPSASFGSPEDVIDDYTYSITYGLEVGNRWYFLPQESFGFGLMVNWLDVSGTQKKTNNDQGKLERATLDVAVLEFGPLGTYAISDAMGLDLYYNLRPTIISTAYKIDEEDSEGFGGYGVTHAFGLNFRYRLLIVGAEYVLGKVKVSQDSTDDEIWMDEQIYSDCFRVLVGIKF